MLSVNYLLILLAAAMEVGYTAYMADTLADILAGRFDDEPPEIKAIKQYVQDHFNQAVAVAVRANHITITTRTSALAGALRPHIHKMQQLCGTGKRLTIRIG